MNPKNDFISSEATDYKFKIGRHIASSLSGFIAGIVVASVIWLAAVYIANIAR